MGFSLKKLGKAILKPTKKVFSAVKKLPVVSDIIRPTSDLLSGRISGAVSGLLPAASAALGAVGAAYAGGVPGLLAAAGGTASAAIQPDDYPEMVPTYGAPGGGVPMLTSGGGFSMADLPALLGQAGQAFKIRELGYTGGSNGTSPALSGGSVIPALGSAGGINVPVTGTSPVEYSEVYEYCMPADPAKRRKREWLIRMSINSGIRVTPKKIMAAVKLLGVEGTALAMNWNRPAFAPLVQPEHVSGVVIDALTRRRRRRCVISRRDVSQVRRTARAFASLSSDLASIKGGRGRAAPRRRHKAGCRCFACK